MSGILEMCSILELYAILGGVCYNRVPGIFEYVHVNRVVMLK